MHPLDVWKKGERPAAAKMDLEREAIVMSELFGGDGLNVTRTQSGTTISLQDRVRPAVGAQVFYVWAALTPGGLYQAYTFDWDVNIAGETQLDPAESETNLANILIVNSTTLTQCYFLNLPEYGTTNHDLLEGANEAAPIAVGTWSNITFTDGLRLAQGVGVPWATCVNSTDAAAAMSMQETARVNAISCKSLADGQLANAKGTLYTVAASTVAHVSHIVLTNVTAGALTVNLYLKRSGSTSRKILDTYSLAAHTSVTLPGEESAYRLSAGDLIEGDASAATSIDYFIDGGTEAA